MKLKSRKGVNYMSDEILFYIGIAVVICSILIGIIFFLISKVKKVRLNTQLNEEYGEEAN